MQVNLLSRVLGEPNVAGSEDVETSQIVKSADRAFKVLELFDVLRREALVSEVSMLLDMPQSSTSALVRSMVMTGYLHFNPETHAFSPTTRVALLGNWVNGPMISEGLLTGLLQRVNARTRQAVVVATRNRIWSEYIHVVQATEPVRLFVVKGTRRPLIRTATGLMLIADLPDPDIKRIALRTHAEADPETPRTPMTELMEQVNAVRQQGWAFMFDTVTKGGAMIAMRLSQDSDDEQLVIGIAGLTDHLREHRDSYLAALREEIGRYVENRKQT